VHKKEKIKTNFKALILLERPEAGGGLSML
jgi:hypothetical protein